MAANTIHPLNPGDSLGPFQVQARIAAGGSSMVYAAVDPLLNRQVAIKQLLPQVDDTAFRQRFRQEAAIQRQVCTTHPGLVQLVDAVEEPRGVFLILEYVDGQSLEQVLQKTGNPLDATQSLRIVWAIAQALQKVHEAGVLHRDLKPANVIVQTPVPGQQKFPIKIADLGVATLVAEQEAMALGSVRYMSPELLQGQPADARADLYSLGMVFYELLIGRTLFQDVFKAVLKDERNQAVRWMKWHTNPRATAPMVHTVHPALPETLGHLVAKAMAKDPLDRFPSAAAMAEAIERHFTAEGAATRHTEQAQLRTPGSPALGIPGSGVVGVAGVGMTNAAAPGATGAHLPGAGATARLPEKKKTSKAVWALAGSAAFTTVLLGVGLWQMRGPSKEAKQAQTLAMQDGKQALDGGQWDLAMARYQAVLDTPEDQRLKALRPEAEAGFYTAQAEAALADNDLATAKSAWAKLRQNPVAEAAWLDQIRATLDRQQIMDRHVTDVESALDAGRLGEARQALDAWLRAGLLFTDDEQAVFDALSARQIALETQAKLEHDLAEVDRLESRGLNDEAMERLRRMESRYADTVVAERLGALIHGTRRDQHVADAQASIVSGDWLAAVRSFEQALAEVPGDVEVAEALADARQQEALGRGRQLLAQGDVTEARQAFAEALTFGESDEAMAALGQLDQQGQQEALIAQGDQAMAQGQWVQAVNAFRTAVRLGAANTPTTNQAATKGRAAETALATSQGQQALSQGDWETARQRFTAALALTPNHPAATQGIADVSRGNQYESDMAKGDTHMQAQRFGQAIRAYRDAQKQIDTEQIRNKITDTEFAQLIAMAQSALASQDPASAKAYLLTARRLRPGPLVDRMLGELAEQDGGGA